MKFVKATETVTGDQVWINVALARVITGTKLGTVVAFDEGDQITVNEEPEVLIGAAAK
jgi:hypothetical protein